jgi:uncharacterized protein with beta-barrel porin domain
MYSNHKNTPVKLGSNFQEQIKKISQYAMIGSFALGSTIGTYSTANAANVASGITDDDNIATAYVFNIAAKTLTVTSENSGSSDVLTVQTGAITDTAAGAIITVLTKTTDDSTLTATLASVVLDATAGAMTITDVDTAPGILTVNVTGALTTDGTLTVTTLEDSDDENLVFDVAGALTVDGLTALNAGGTGVTGNIEMNLSNASVNFNGGLTMADVSTTGLSNVSFDGGSATTVAGTIDGDADNEGTIHVDTSSNAAVTFTGAIGATNDVFLIDIDETAIFNSTVATKGMTVVAAHDATFKANLTLGATKATNSGIMSFAATSAQTISGAIEDGKIDIENTSGLVTFSGALGASTTVDEIESDASTTTLFSSTIDTALADVDGHITLTQDDNTGTNVTLADGATIIIDDTITNGQKVFLTSTGVTNASLVAGGSIKFPANLSDGQTLELFEDVTNGHLAAIVVDTEAVLIDTALRTYTASSQTGDDIVVTVADRSASDAATQLGTTVNESTALLQATIAAATDATTLDAFTNALNAEAGMSAIEDTNLSKQVSPQTDLISGSTIAAQAVTGSVQGIMSNRMASLRSGDAYFGTGVAAGGMSAQSGFIQVFGSTAEQESTKVGSGTQAGYDSETQGIAIGFDGVTDNGMTVGVSLSSANTDVDGLGTGKSSNSIDSYSASLYMDMATDSGYVEGSLTYGINENTTSRSVTAAGLNRTYTGSYDSTSISLNLTAGAPSEVASGYLTPFGGLTVTNMDTDDYLEKSTAGLTDTLRLKVDQNDVTSILGTVGIKYHNEMSNGGTPMISLALNNELGDNTIDSTNTYQGGGTPFKTSTAVEELSATLGLGYSYGSDSASIEFAYEADVNDDDYLSHYGSIKIVGKF